MYRNNLCGRVVSLLERYVDQELSDLERNFVDEHLDYCQCCREELNLIQEIDDSVRGISVPVPEPEFWEYQRESILEDIGNETTAIHRTGGSRRTGTRLMLPFITAAAAMLLFFTMVEDTHFELNESAPVKTAANIDSVPLINEQTAKEDQDIEKAAEQPAGNEEVRPEEPELVAVIFPEEDSELELLPEVEVALTDHIAINEPFTESELDSKAVDISTPVVRVSAAEVGVSTALIRNDSDKETTTRFSSKVTVALPKEDVEEFDLYLQNQKIIAAIEDPYEQIFNWNEFLIHLEGKMTVDLVINDIYDIYNKNLSESSPGHVRKSALEFITNYKNILTERLGESRYASVLKYLESIQD